MVYTNALLINSVYHACQMSTANVEEMLACGRSIYVHTRGTLVQREIRHGHKILPSRFANSHIPTIAFLFTKCTSII